MGAAFRFIQGGDFRLGEPLQGISLAESGLAAGGSAGDGYEVSGPALTEAAATLVREAPYRAVEQLISAAMAHRVAFVVLAGDLWSVDAGPGPADFLRQQFQRLADRDIPVYWSAGRHHTSDTWASAIKFPANVHRFSTTAQGPQIVRHKKQVVAQVCGLSWQRGQALSDPDGLDSALYTIFACCAPRIPRQWSTSELPYWALGGSTARHTRTAAGRIAHAAGTPQARWPHQLGPHGATLVTVQGQQARLKPIATAALRWHVETLELPERATLDLLRERMLDKMQRIVKGTAPWLVRWEVNAPGELGAQLRHGGLDQQCLRLHRQDLTAHKIPALPVSLTAGYREFRPEWLDEDSLLSEFLQVIRDFREQQTGLQGEDRLASEGRGTWEVPLTPLDAEGRAQLLRDAAALGIDLLTGDVELDAFQAAWGTS